MKLDRKGTGGGVHDAFVSVGGIVNHSACVVLQTHNRLGVARYRLQQNLVRFRAPNLENSTFLTILEKPLKLHFLSCIY